MSKIKIEVDNSIVLINNKFFGYMYKLSSNNKYQLLFNIINFSNANKNKIKNLKKLYDGNEMNYVYENKNENMIYDFINKLIDVSFYTKKSNKRKRDDKND